MADMQMLARTGRTALRADDAVRTSSRWRPTRAARKQRSTGSPFHRTHWNRIAGIASPRSSLIISDEALSSETGKDTEFVVLMGGEPQGGIKFRRRGPETKVRYERPGDRLPSWPSPFAGPFSTR